jgi:hypothetical protein
MNEVDREQVEKFLHDWKGSSGHERANKDSFFRDLCDALGVERPPAKGKIPGDPYCFEKDIKIPHPSGKITTGSADFYKAGHFLIEAKQGGETSGKGTAKRGTATYKKEMEKAFVQALSYTRHLEANVPFLLTCDIGSHFELWLGFSGDYGGYGARRTIPLEELQQEDTFDLFVDIFTEPHKRNPEKIAARVTREVAADLAQLAKTLEAKQSPQEVAGFLMRCIFTMFAEDVGLLPEHLFTQALKERWISQPERFKSEVEALWQAMNAGTPFGFTGKLLQFNGGLFADSSALALSAEQLQILLDAAQRDWKQVEPAIFGTLLERALDPKERSKLGAHYTPRSYVERLVRPVVLEPIRERWNLVQAEVKQVLENEDKEPTAAQQKKAIALIQDFLKELREIKILDPACGSGNFLYVTLDLLKSLEAEVLRRLGDITGKLQLELDFEQVNPSQFLGIEINPRAAAIADLVIWIGYLQWHFKRFGNIPPTEPVLRAYKNIECRDAVLAYDGKEPAIDAVTGKPRTRWGGRMMKHPVTGEDVPDPTDQISIYRYINPRPAEWQEADYIVSNPPFLGKLHMLSRLREGYIEALREVYQGKVSDGADFVMYWWYRSAQLLAERKICRFGLITTKSISQSFNCKVVSKALKGKIPISLIFAIPNHPWVDTSDAAAVRIAMTAAELGEKSGVLKKIVLEENIGGEFNVQLTNEKGQIYEDLRVGANLPSTGFLKSNSLIASTGLLLGSRGFLLTVEEANKFQKTQPPERPLIFPLRHGEDLTERPRNIFVIDTYGWSESELISQAPELYQRLRERVYPERQTNRDKRLRTYWWLFRRSNERVRSSISGLTRYIATSETAKHRTFIFLDKEIRPEHKLIVIASDDAFLLGVLSSHIHVKWALAAGGNRGVGNDPVYVKTKCFDKFPFPDSTPEQKQKIRDLGERLDAHRKRMQAQHPDITITGMYNRLEKLRAGQPFTDADRAYNDKALVSTLKQIHDELDAAVIDAYGWSQNISDEEILEQLVALNADRAAEERNGLIRWLRPEYQVGTRQDTAIQGVIEGVTEPEETVAAPAEQKTWPKQPKDQLAAIRDLLRTLGGEWTVEQVMAQFKGAHKQKKAIASHLESLEALGILLSSKEEGAICWYYAELQKAG